LLTGWRTEHPLRGDDSAFLSGPSGQPCLRHTPQDSSLRGYFTVVRISTVESRKKIEQNEGLERVAYQRPGGMVGNDRANGQHEEGVVGIVDTTEGRRVT